MHTNRISLARKILLWIGAAASLILLTGCEMTLTNLTPSSLPENPSQIYTLSLRVTPRGASIAPDSINPQIIIDGQNHRMTQSPLGENIYEFDYQLPPGRNEMAYYYLVTYQSEGSSGQRYTREVFTDLQHAKVMGRYVLALEVNRGPVGARVSVLGRGFTPEDSISFDNTPARVVYESPTSLSFFVPPVEPNRNYRVILSGATGNSPVGTFRVDGSSIQVSPSTLTLSRGERQSLTFTIPTAAPSGGLLLDVTTDVPESVIMPEVVVPAGQSSVTIPVEGGVAGTGSLYLKGFGTGEVMIPVTVTGQ